MVERVRAETGEQGAQHAGARFRIGERPVGERDVDAERVGEDG